MSRFYDEKGNIKRDLLDKEAEKWARLFVKEEKKKLTANQLRKFYNEFKALEKKVKVDKKGFEKTLPLIKMVKSKAAYSANPENQKIPTRFKDFLWEHIDAINEERDFDAFILLFEAVVGFCYGLGMKNN